MGSKVAKRKTNTASTSNLLAQSERYLRLGLLIATVFVIIFTTSQYIANPNSEGELLRIFFSVRGVLYFVLFIYFIITIPLVLKSLLSKEYNKFFSLFGYCVYFFSSLHFRIPLVVY